MTYISKARPRQNALNPPDIAANLAPIMSALTLSVEIKEVGGTGLNSPALFEFRLLFLDHAKFG
jgi:hypothetical protein